MIRSKTVLVAVALIALTAMISTGAISASAGKQAPKSERLSGTWMTTVTLEDPPPGVAATFRALNTFLPSGELLVSSSVGLPATRSLAHGDWIRTGNRRFASSFVFFRFDPAGAFIGSQRVHRTILLAASLNAFTSTDVVEILDPSGTVIRSSRATEVGQRLTVQQIVG